MKIKLTTITPVHISTRNSYTLLEGIVSGNIFYKLDPFSFIDSEEKLREFTNWLEKESNPKLSEFLNRDNSSIKEKCIYKANCNYSEDDISEIMECIKSGNIPYIPGTSVKGCIRTILLWWWIKSNPKENFFFLKEELKKITRTRKGKLAKMLGEEIIKKIFNCSANPKNSDAKYDILRFLLVSDFSATDYTLSINRVNVYSFGKGKKKTFFIEGVEGEFIGEIKLNIPLMRRCINNKEFSLLWDKLSFFGFNEEELTNYEEERLNSIFINHFEKLCKEYYKWCLEKEEHLKEYIKYPNELMENSNFIRIGFGTGTIYKTVIKLIEERNAKIFLDIVNNFKLGKYPRMLANNKLNPPFPKTCKVLDNGHPLGWLKWEKSC